MVMQDCLYWIRCQGLYNAEANRVAGIVTPFDNTVICLTSQITGILYNLLNQ